MCISPITIYIKGNQANFRNAVEISGKHYITGIYQDAHLRYKPFFTRSDRYRRQKTIAMQVDCGKCSECVAKKMRQWSFRLKLQLMKQESYFVTLTYNDWNLPTVVTRFKEFDQNTGELFDKPIRDDYSNPYGLLVYHDFQLFMKRFRRTLDYWYGIKDVKFFSCGEYAPESHVLANGKITKGYRPHWHCIISFTPNHNSKFGYRRDIKKKSRNPKNGVHLFNRFDNYYQIRPFNSGSFNLLINESWSNGFVQTSPVRNAEACSKYITKYILKSKRSETNYLQCQEQFPFCYHCSQQIGNNQFEDMYFNIVAKRQWCVPVKPDQKLDNQNQEEDLNTYVWISNSMLKPLYFKNRDQLNPINKMLEPFKLCVEFLEMSNLREDWINSHPRDDDEQIKHYQLLRIIQDKQINSLNYDE